MRKLFYLLLVINSLQINAQSTRVKFEYDSEGNQAARIICFGCAARPANDSISASKKSITDEDMIKDETDNRISYYPNPVSEELYVKWVNEKENYVSSIELFSQTGQSLQRYVNLKGNETKTLSFINYPSGFYNVVIIYNNEEKKTLKIVKK